MRKVAGDVMTTDPAVCPADATLDQVASLMVQHDCRAITIIDLAERPLGIVTDRDIIRRVVAEGKNPLAYPAETCMSRPVVTVAATQPLEDVLATMAKHEIQRVPVVDDEGRCIGLVTRTDVSAPQQLR